MAVTQPTRRRWSQFSLGTVFWLMLTVALTIALLREHRQKVQAERETAEWAQERMRWFEEAQRLERDRSRYVAELRELWELEVQDVRDVAWMLGVIDDPPTDRPKSPTP